MGFIQPTLGPNPPIDLSGKIVIVTGGNSGLGFASAQQLLASKAGTVILACRTVSKGEAARLELLNDPEVKKNNPNGKVVVMELDMERFDSILEFSSQVKQGLPALHILLLNAGVGAWTYATSPTGHETVLQVNYLSNALLALELLPLLESTAKSTGSPTRLSWVGSRMHATSPLTKHPIPASSSVLAHCDSPSNFDKATSYSTSKLLCVMFIIELAKRVPSEKVVINSMCPGMVKTNMAANLPGYARLAVNAIFSVRGRTPKQGAWCIVNAAVVAGGETHGRFLADKELIAPTPYLGSDAGKETQRRLWEETMAELVKVDSTLHSIFSS